MTLVPSGGMMPCRRQEPERPISRPPCVKCGGRFRPQQSHTRTQNLTPNSGRVRRQTSLWTSFSPGRENPAL